MHNQQAFTGLNYSPTLHCLCLHAITVFLHHEVHGVCLRVNLLSFPDSSRIKKHIHTLHTIRLPYLCSVVI